MDRSLTVSKIVDVLIHDEHLLRESTRFATALDTPVGERLQWEALFTMGTTSTTAHFTKLLENWVTRLGSSATLGRLGRLLTQLGFISSSELLGNLGHDNSIIKINTSAVSPNKPFSFGVTLPSPYFIGRVAEVKQLTELFLNRSYQPVVVISGMGGQGKTELCRKFMSNLQNSDTHSLSMIWLNGDQATNLTSSINQLTQALEIPTKDEGRPIAFHQLVAHISDKISTNPVTNSWLIIIDNVDDIYPEFQETVPILVRKGAFVLITSRKINIFSGEAKQLKLDVMSDVDAQDLVKTYVRPPPAQEQVQELCKALGNHTLALPQAIAYINAQQNENTGLYRVRDYLIRFAKDKTL